MPVQVATEDDLPALRRLLRLARYVYCNAADEDLAAIVARGLTVLAGEPGLPTDLFMADPEERPETLPAGAPTRLQVRALALHHTPWADDTLPALLNVLRTASARRDPASPAVLHVYASEPWMGQALASVGFEVADTVVFLRLDRLRRLNLGNPPFGPATLRPAQTADLPAIAALDIASFGAFWHMGVPDLTELLFRGRTVLAEHEGRIVGYTATLFSAGDEAHLARLAVHPHMQRQGIGRQLLDDAIRYCQLQGYHALALNTQRSNGRSQTVYHAAGFRESGLALPVYTCLLPG